MQTPSGISRKRHRFPPEMIAHVAWLYVRINLGLRKVDETLVERGIDVYLKNQAPTAKVDSQSARNLWRQSHNFCMPRQSVKNHRMQRLHGARLTAPSAVHQDNSAVCDSPRVRSGWYRWTW